MNRHDMKWIEMIWHDHMTRNDMTTWHEMTWNDYEIMWNDVKWYELNAIAKKHSNLFCNPSLKRRWSKAEGARITPSVRIAKNRWASLLHKLLWNNSFASGPFSAPCKLWKQSPWCLGLSGERILLSPSWIVPEKHSDGMQSFWSMSYNVI